MTDSVRRMGQWMPSFDLALIEAGEQSGRLDASFKLLAMHYEERARMVKQTISDLLYPLFTLHMALVVFPFVTFVTTGNTTRFVLTVFGVLIPLYAFVFFLIFACQGRRGENWRALLERILRFVPVLGTARRELALSRAGGRFGGAAQRGSAHRRRLGVGGHGQRFPCATALGAGMAAQAGEWLDAGGAGFRVLGISHRFQQSLPYGRN